MNSIPEHSSDTPRIRTRARESTNGQTMLLHVNLPAKLVMAVRGLAADERRTITSQVALLLEKSPDLLTYMADH